MTKKHSHRRLVVLVVVAVLVLGAFCIRDILVDAVVNWGAYQEEPAAEAPPERWHRVHYSDSYAPPFALVEVLSPPYGPGAREPDVVTVLWDGKVVFDGKLPERGEGERSFPAPLHLLSIRTSVGHHVLGVVHVDGRRQTVDVHLTAGGQEYYELFGYIDGKEMLIQSLGSTPRFR